jgi:hypothetical protein
MVRPFMHGHAEVAMATNCMANHMFGGGSQAARETVTNQSAAPCVWAAVSWSRGATAATCLAVTGSVLRVLPASDSSFAFFHTCQPSSIYDTDGACPTAAGQSLSELTADSIPAHTADQLMSCLWLPPVSFIQQYTHVICSPPRVSTAKADASTSCIFVEYVCMTHQRL